MTSWETELNKPPAGCTTLEWQWLSSTSSLTQKLRDILGPALHFQLLNAKWAQAYEEEKQLLVTHNYQIFAEPIWTREIIHLHQQQTWIWGRTLIPSKTLQETSLNAEITQSIGDIIFQDPQLKRHSMSLGLLSEEHSYFHSVRAYSSNPLSLLWARRSLFFYQNYPLLVIEVFLPDFFANIGTLKTYA